MHPPPLSPSKGKEVDQRTLQARDAELSFCKWDEGGPGPAPAPLPHTHTLSLSPSLLLSHTQTLSLSLSLAHIIQLSRWPQAE